MRKILILTFIFIFTNSCSVNKTSFITVYKEELKKEKKYKLQYPKEYNLIKGKNKTWYTLRDKEGVDKMYFHFNDEYTPVDYYWIDSSSEVNNGGFIDGYNYPNVQVGDIDIQYGENTKINNWKDIFKLGHYKIGYINVKENEIMEFDSLLTNFHQIIGY